MQNLQSSTKFQLLEINLISAQDLKRPSFTPLKSLKTYVVVWIDPKQKLRSRVNVGGFKNPTWNDKFVYAVDDKMLENSSTAQLVFEFYYVRRFGKDRLVGTSRVLLGGFENVYKCLYCEEMLGKFRALHVRRPNGDIQGLLNIGLTILDGLPYQVINGQLWGSHRLLITKNWPEELPPEAVRKTTAG